MSYVPFTMFVPGSAYHVWASAPVTAELKWAPKIFVPFITSHWLFVKIESYMFVPGIT